jgi:acylglycerol lipase
MGVFESELKTADNLSLFVRAWEPETEGRAVVCLIHGLGEHSDRYAHVAATLNGSGYIVYAFDLRGHGRSDGIRGHAPSYDTLMDDISSFLAAAELRYPQLPLFLYGHSLGGSLVINYVLRRHPILNGVIVTAPGFRPAFAVPRWKMNMLRILYNLWPSFSVSNELDINGLAHDPEVIRAYRSDPLVHNRITPGLALAALKAGEWAIRQAPVFPQHILLMHGSDDPLTSVAASREFAAGAGEMCTLKIWDGLYHEIHNEPERNQVFSTMLAWLKKRMLLH